MKKLSLNYFRPFFPTVLDNYRTPTKLMGPKSTTSIPKCFELLWKFQGKIIFTTTGKEMTAYLIRKRTPPKLMSPTCGNLAFVNEVKAFFSSKILLLFRICATKFRFFSQNVTKKKYHILMCNCFPLLARYVKKKKIKFFVTTIIAIYILSR